MAHGHHHHGQGAHHHAHATGNLKLAFFLNLSFTIIEVVGGVLTNSFAILSDALHDLGDSFALGMSWYLEKVSTKKSTASYSYGYRRYSILAAAISSLILIGGSVLIIAKAIPRIIHPEPVHVNGMIGLSLLGIAINGISVLRMKKSKSLNEQVVMWHLLEDVLGWAAVLIVSIVLLFKPWYVLDAALSLIITAVVLYNVFKRLRETLKIFLQKTPEEVNPLEIIAQLNQIEYVKKAHDLHIWSLDGEMNIASIHLLTDKNLNDEQQLQIRTKARNCFKNHSIEHSTIELEWTLDGCEACN